MAAFSVLTLLTTSISASAWIGLVGGSTAGGGFTLTNTPFGTIGTNLDGTPNGTSVFAWRVDMYVSANPDGKINKDIDTIGDEHSLPLVGSLLCISETYGRDAEVYGGAWAGHYTYLQTNYTNQTRTTFSTTGKLTPTNSNGDITGSLAEYTLPTLEQFEPNNKYYRDASGHTVAIAKTELGGIELFKGQYGINTTFTDVATNLTTDSTYANARTTEILQQLLNKTSFKQDSFNALSLQLKQNVLDIATSQNLNPVDNFDEIYNRYLLPTNPTDLTQSSPMVEWAMVITPLYRFECNAPFYCSSSSSVTDTNKGTKYVGGGDCVALDAYWFAQSNVTTTALGKAGMYTGLYYQSGDKLVWQGQTQGLLYFFLNKTTSDPSNSGAPAAAAYCTQSNDQYLGVYTTQGSPSQYAWAQRLVDDAAAPFISQPKPNIKSASSPVFITAPTRLLNIVIRGLPSALMRCPPPTDSTKNGKPYADIRT